MSSVWDELEYFDPEEFDYPGRMNDVLLRRLDQARRLAGRPFYIKSDYREGDPRSHGKGMAVDFGVSQSPRIISGSERWSILNGLLEAGFDRIGLYDKHVHADVDWDLPRRVIWVGESQ